MIIINYVTPPKFSENNFKWWGLWCWKNHVHISSGYENICIWSSRRLLKTTLYCREKKKKMVFGRFVVFTTTLVWTLQWWFHIITSNSHSSHSDSRFNSTFDSNSLRPPIPDSQFDSNSLRFPIPDSTLDSNSLRPPIPDAKFGTWSPWPAPSLTWFRNRVSKTGPVLRNSESFR